MIFFLCSLSHLLTFSHVQHNYHDHSNNRILHRSRSSRKPYHLWHLPWFRGSKGNLQRSHENRFQGCLGSRLECQADRWRLHLGQGASDNARSNRTTQQSKRRKHGAILRRASRPSQRLTHNPQTYTHHETHTSNPWLCHCHHVARL